MRTWAVGKAFTSWVARDSLATSFPFFVRFLTIVAVALDYTKRWMSTRKFMMTLSTTISDPSSSSSVASCFMDSKMVSSLTTTSCNRSCLIWEVSDDRISGSWRRFWATGFGSVVGNRINEGEQKRWVKREEVAGRREKLKMRIVEKFEKANRLARAILRNGERNDNKKNSPHSTYSCQCNIRNWAKWQRT